MSAPAGVRAESYAQARRLATLRTVDLTSMDPADTTGFDQSVVHTFTTATRPGADPHPFAEQALATVLLLAAASSARREYHYRHLAHPPRWAKPWRWEELDFDHHGAVITKSTGDLLRRARTEAAIRRRHEDLTSPGAEAARQFLAGQDGLAEELGPVITTHFIAAASVLPPPVPGVSNSPAPSHQQLLERLGEVGGISSLSIINRRSTVRAADRVRAEIEQIAGVRQGQMRGIRPSFITPGGIAVEVDHHGKLTLPGRTVRPQASTRFSSPRTDGDRILGALCRALTEEIGNAVLPEGFTAWSLVHGVLRVDVSLDGVSVPVLVDAQGPAGVARNGHEARRTLALAYLQEAAADRGVELEALLESLQMVRADLLSDRNSDCVLFDQLDARMREES